MSYKASIKLNNDINREFNGNSAGSRDNENGKENIFEEVEWQLIENGVDFLDQSENELLQNQHVNRPVEAMAAPEGISKPEERIIEDSSRESNLDHSISGEIKVLQFELGAIKKQFDFHVDPIKDSIKNLEEGQEEQKNDLAALFVDLRSYILQSEKRMNKLERMILEIGDSAGN